MASFTATATITISEAVYRALEEHSQLRQAEISLRLAELELDSTIETFTLPTLSFRIQPPNLTLDGLSGDLRGSLDGSLSLPLGSSSQLSGQLDVVWDFEDGSWGFAGWTLKYSQKIDLSEPSSVRDQIQRKKEAVEDSQASLESTRNKLILETIESYSQLLSEAAAVEQAEQQLAGAKENLSTTEDLAEEGLKGSQSLTQARLDVLGSQIKLDKLKTSYEQDLEKFGRETLGTSDPIELNPISLPLEELTAEAEQLLTREDLIGAVVETSTSVLSAMRNVEETKDDLSAVLLEVLPDLSIEAGYTSDGWTIGGAIVFDFFSPDRDERIAIARARLSLAEEQLSDARNQALNSLLNQQATLQDALRDLERLALEEEKWTLEEQVMKSKYEIGTIGEDDWKDFVESKEAFDLEARERETTLLLSYLSYQDVLELEMEWEEWL
jgi:hypothetical protein